MQTVTKNTHELREGDVVSVYGVRLRLRDRKEFPSNAAGGVVTFQTDLLFYDETSPMLRGEADRWVIQGNDLARWAVVEDDPLALSAPLAPYAPPPPPARPERTYWRVVTDIFSGDETVRRHGPKYNTFEACAEAAERLSDKYPYGYADVQEYDAETDKVVPYNAV